jgi:hypothetical protein
MPVYCKMDLSPAEQKVADLKREITTLEWEINELASQMGPIRHTPGHVHPAHWDIPWDRKARISALSGRLYRAEWDLEKLTKPAAEPAPCYYVAEKPEPVPAAKPASCYYVAEKPEPVPAPEPAPESDAREAYLANPGVASLKLAYHMKVFMVHGLSAAAPTAPESEDLPPSLEDGAIDLLP